MPESQPQRATRRLTATTLRLAVTAVLAIIVVDTAIVLSSFRALKEHEEGVRLSNELLFSLSELISHAKDAETGQRGFTLTGDDAYLDPYRGARAALEADQAKIRQLMLQIDGHDVKDLEPLRQNLSQPNLPSRLRLPSLPQHRPRSPWPSRPPSLSRSRQPVAAATAAGTPGRNRAITWCRSWVPAPRLRLRRS